MGSYYCGCPHHFITNRATHLSVHQLYKIFFFSEKQHHKKLTGKNITWIYPTQMPDHRFLQPALGFFLHWLLKQTCQREINFRKQPNMHKSNLTLT